MKSFIALICLSLFTINCSGENATAPETTSGAPTETGPSLGLRPQGDTEISPDLSQVSDELKQVFDYIDENFDDDVRRL